MKNNLKLLFVSLGCDKNLVDTEFMLGMLRDDGIEMTDDEQEADIIIVNTCCFINDAKEESINTILEMAELKKEARLKSLIVTGCLAQRYKEEIASDWVCICIHLFGRRISRNILVTCHTPTTSDFQIADPINIFHEFFLIDTPCSGE